VLALAELEQLTRQAEEIGEAEEATSSGREWVARWRRGGGEHFTVESWLRDYGRRGGEEGC